jgi:hypothetical protein
MNGYRGILLGLQCSHSATKIELEPPGSEHYGRLRCAACGCFIRFVAKPKNVELRQLNGYRLAKLQMLPGLGLGDREFLRGLAKNAKFSPKQQEQFDRICQTYLQEGGQSQ